MAHATWASQPLCGPPWVLEYPVLSLNDHLNPSQGQQKGFGKSQIFENFQVPLNCLFEAFGGPGLQGPSSHYVGPHGRSSTRIATKWPPKPIPGVTDRVRKKSNFQKILRCHTIHPNNSNFGSFRGGMAWVSRAWRPRRRGFPWCLSTHIVTIDQKLLPAPSTPIEIMVTITGAFFPTQSPSAEAPMTPLPRGRKPGAPCVVCCMLFYVVCSMLYAPLPLLRGPCLQASMRCLKILENSTFSETLPSALGWVWVIM